MISIARTAYPLRRRRAGRGTQIQTRTATSFPMRTSPFQTTAGGSDIRPANVAPQDSRRPQIARVRAKGLSILPADVRDPFQTLDLWMGLLTSTFSIDGFPVKVTVASHPTRDLLAVRVESPLVGSGKLGIRIALPRGHDIRTKN